MKWGIGLAKKKKWGIGPSHDSPERTGQQWIHFYGSTRLPLSAKRSPLQVGLARACCWHPIHRWVRSSLSFLASFLPSRGRNIERKESVLDTRSQKSCMLSIYNRVLTSTCQLFVNPLENLNDCARCTTLKPIIY